MVVFLFFFYKYFFKHNRFALLQNKPTSHTHTPCQTIIKQNSKQETKKKNISNFPFHSRATILPSVESFFFFFFFFSTLFFVESYLSRKLSMIHSPFWEEKERKKGEKESKVGWAITKAILLASIIIQSSFFSRRPSGWFFLLHCFSLDAFLLSDLRVLFRKIQK